MNSCFIYKLSAMMPNVPVVQISSPQTLHCASTAEEAKILLNKGARVNDCNQSGETALYLAVVQKKGMTLVKTLLAAGADPKIATVLFDTPLHYAYSAEIVDQLVSHGAEIDAVNVDGLSPLHNAIKLNKDLKIIKALLSANANVNLCLKGSEEETCLHIAATAKVITELISKGAAVNALDKLGRTPLHSAIIKKKHVSILQELLRNDAKIQIFDSRSYSSIFICLIFCPAIYKTITKLLEHDSDEVVRVKAHSLLKTSKHELLDYESRKYFVKFLLLTNFDRLREELYNNFLGNNSNYIYKCVCEILDMMWNKFIGDTTLYEIVTKKVRVRALRHSYKTNKFRLMSKFPIYFDIIWQALKPFLEREIFINRIVLDPRWVTISSQKEEMKIVVLNSDCVQEICLYLSNEDLENFIEAYKDCGQCY